MKLIKLLMLILCVSALASCSTMEKFTVKGTPGTKIYTPQKHELATIGNNGRVKIKVPSDAYYGYLYTHNDSLNLWVPFGLDNKKKNHAGAKAALAAEFTGASIGVGALLVGTIVAIASGGEEPLGAIMAGAGGALAGGGAFAGMVTSARMGQLSYQYNFTYRNNLSTNADLSLSNYITPPILLAKPEKSTLSRLRSGKSSDKNDSRNNQAQRTKNKQQNQRTKIQLKTKAEKVEGEYAGQAYLSQGRVRVEEFDAVTVIIAPVNDNTVTVDVVVGSESFFDEPLTFKVRNTATNSYTLASRSQPNALITINGNELNFNHPSVNLGGNSYKLIVEASK